MTRHTDRAAALRQALRRAPAVLLILDGLLVALHFLAGGRCDLLDVHADVSLAGWWIGAKLLAMGVLAWWFGLAPHGPRRLERAVLWRSAALVFAALSLEKTLQLHQRLSRAAMHTGLGGILRARLLSGDAMKDAYGWVILLLPVMLALLYFLVTFFREEFRHETRTRWWWLGGLALVLCHPALETVIYWLPPVDAWTPQTMRVYAAVLLLRRAAELTGLSCLLIALLRHWRLSLERPPR